MKGTLDIIAAYLTRMDDDASDIATVQRETALALIQVKNAKRYSYMTSKCSVCGFKSYHYVEAEGFKFPICQNCQGEHGRSITI